MSNTQRTWTREQFQRWGADGGRRGQKTLTRERALRMVERRRELRAERAERAKSAAEAANAVEEQH